MDGLKPHPPPLSSQKNKMLIFGLCSTSDDWPGWLMDLSPIHHPSTAKIIKCSFLDYVQLLVIGWAGWWTRTPSATPLCSFLDYVQLLMISWVIRAKNVDRNAKKWRRPPKSSKNKMFIFGLSSTSDDQPSDLSKKCWPKHKKMKKAQ